MTVKDCEHSLWFNTSPPFTALAVSVSIITFKWWAEFLVTTASSVLRKHVGSNETVHIHWHIFFEWIPSSNSRHRATLSRPSSNGQTVRTSASILQQLASCRHRRRCLRSTSYVSASSHFSRCHLGLRRLLLLLLPFTTFWDYFWYQQFGIGHSE